jgi:hypothetical protein
VVDVGREMAIRLWVVKWLSEEHLVDGLRGWLDAPRASEVLAECLPDEAPEGHTPGPRRVGCSRVEIERKEELSPVHV